MERLVLHTNLKLVDTGGAASAPDDAPDAARSALHEQAAARLRTMLIEGVIPPGAKLNERELSEQLRVSRTPLREAIRTLAAEGLVDLMPNRGAVAVQMAEADVVHAFELLAELEGLSGDLAAQRVTEPELTELQALHFEMQACFARRNLSGYYALNARIHAGINAAAKNPLLTRTYDQINARLQSMRFRSNQNETKWTRAMQEHQTMIEALSARDAAGLRAVLVGHLHGKRDTVLELLRTAPATTGRAR